MHRRSTRLAAALGLLALGACARNPQPEGGSVQGMRQQCSLDCSIEVYNPRPQGVEIVVRDDDAHNGMRDDDARTPLGYVSAHGRQTFVVPVRERRVRLAVRAAGRDIERLSVVLRPGQVVRVRLSTGPTVYGPATPGR